MRGRTLAGALARRAPAILLTRARRPAPGAVFHELAREGAPSVALGVDYRHSVKGSWMHAWWPARALTSVQPSDLPEHLQEIARDVALSRTLPAPLAELAEAAVAAQQSLPDRLALSGRYDDRLGAPIVEPVPDRFELESRAAGYRSLALEIKRAVGARRPFESLRVLDLGCGSGYLAFALAGLGAAEVVGVDLDPVDYVAAGERRLMLELLAGDHAEAVRLEAGDVHALPFGDATFDLVCSITAVEHFADLDRSVAEMARVLAPGGTVYHGVEPWFAKRGGHGLCTLDFPWGHVRLTPEEFEDYVRRFRPYEAEDALAYYREGFQRPARTLAESRHAFAQAFRIVEWRETPLSALDPHRRLADQAVVRDCRRLHPAVTKRDLLTVTYTAVGRR